MAQDSFEVVFDGTLVEGAALDQVKANVAALFKVEVAKVERLFSGASVAIKKGVDEQTAKKYQMALHKAGAICQVVDTAATPTPVEAAPVAKPAPAEAEPEVAVSPGDVGLQKSVVKEAPQGLGELGSATVDAPGTVLIEHQEVPVPQIDTSELSMDLSGVELTQHEEVPPPQVDISGITLGDEGEPLGEEEPVTELEVDISSMSMDEPGVTLVEHEEVPEPQIDTSQLSME